MLYKGIYKIEKWTGKKTPFHKKYYVFDGLGLIFFDSLEQSRSYVRQKSMKLKKIYEASKTIYLRLSDHYFSRLLKFRIYDCDNNLVNDLLSDCLESYRYLAKSGFSHYALSKIRHIYQSLLKITKVLKLDFMFRSITDYYESFYIPYPEYRSTDFVRNNKISIKNNNKNDKKCIA